MRVGYCLIEAAIRDVFVERGVPVVDAELVAQVIAQAEARGYATQGLRRVPELCRLLDGGLVLPAAETAEVKRSPAVVIISANRAIGHPIAVRAVDIASDLASDVALGMVGILNASHIGYLTYYVERAARRGLFAIATTISSPAVAMPGSGHALFGTNPLAFAFPIDGDIFCADLSLARISRGEVIRMKEEGAKFNAPVGYDKAGNATIDPASILEGGIAPLDDSVRGIFINMLFSVLAGPLIGGVANSDVIGTRWLDGPPNKGDLFICIDIEQLTTKERFVSVTSQFLRQMQQAMPSFHVPGRHSREKMQRVLRDGIDVSEEMASFLHLGVLVA